MLLTSLPGFCMATGSEEVLVLAGPAGQVTHPEDDVVAEHQVLVAAADLRVVIAIVVHLETHGTNWVNWFHWGTLQQHQPGHTDPELHQYRTRTRTWTGRIPSFLR